MGVRDQIAERPAIREHLLKSQPMIIRWFNQADTGPVPPTMMPPFGG